MNFFSKMQVISGNIYKEMLIDNRSSRLFKCKDEEEKVELWGFYT